MNILVILKKLRYLFIAVSFIILAVIVDSSFLNPFNVEGLLMDITIVGLLALGQAIVIFTGGIDLSVGNMASMATVVLAWVMINTQQMVTGTMSVILCFLFVMLCCAAIGFISGISTAMLKIPPIIVTMCTMWIARGFSYFLLRGNATKYPEAGVSQIARATIGPIPCVFVFFVVVTVFIYFFLTHTKTGKAIYAIGGSEYAAHLSGIKTIKIKTLAYMASGVFASIGGIILGAYQNTSYPKAANGYELLTVAGVVMGGAVMTGGEGNIINCMLGVVIFRIINKILVFANLAGYLEGIYMGIILLIVLVFSNKKHKIGFDILN